MILVESKREMEMAWWNESRRTLLFLVCLSPVLMFVVSLFASLFYLSPADILNRRRAMAGGPIPQMYKVKKSKFVEEWNGRREITEKSFEATESMVAKVFFYVVVIPYGIYTLTRSEFQNKGDRRYKDCV
jgi:hypothetical protein